MNKSNKIIEFLSKTREIPLHEVKVLTNLVKPISIKKGEFIHLEGDIPKHGTFVLNGILREFYTDSKNVDYIRRFAYKNWWMVDLYELLYEKPAICSVQAIQDSELLIFTKEDCEILIKNCPVTSNILHEISAAEKYSLAKNEKKKRSLSAIENYQSLLKNRPGIDKKIPLFHIASYLNIKPESLSRIRKKINTKVITQQP